MRDADYRKTLQRSSVAMVFAHPLHEWFNWGTVLEAQPDIYYLARGVLEAPGLEDQFRDALAEAGFRGNLTFGSSSEPEIFARYLQRDIGWFVNLRQGLAKWLERVAPDIVYMDAFEWYNSVHDLVPLFVNSILRDQHAQHTTRNCWEHGTAIYAISIRDQERYCATNSRWQRATISTATARSKRKLATRLCNLVSPYFSGANDALPGLISNWSASQFETEFFRQPPTDHDFCSPPQHVLWSTYDERGRARVAAGRSERAISFNDHFQPIAETLLDTNP